jgi:hypothetical protein
MEYSDEAVCASNGVSMRITNEIPAVEENMISKIIVTPNPANDKLNFVLPNAEHFVVQIFDSFGKVVFNGEIKGETNSTIDVSNLINGVYQYSLESSQRKVNGSIVILH